MMKKSKHLAPIFEVRTVTANTVIEELRKDIRQIFSEKTIDGVKPGTELDRG
ncbi:hypothetical protein HHL23_22295 [Chryseobacterium sp. RP-3-3]|uniref:Uncharacterized protein n=1 Tax=Chryseobacterium antibioticum TaxID=2728847 RepID=A0A7Y0AS97_9FLAO|nr:hypothetical protein [Chryseobacterium antibioticum]NML72484.1 hypothetical protein [Chryseobacterium antibioticum]